MPIDFDEEDYPEKEIPWGNPNLVQEVYQDQHLIIVNKPEGMKTHGNQPNEIALLNHVSAYIGQTCYVVHRLDMETSGLVLFAKILLSCLFSIAYWRKKRFLGNIGHLFAEISTARACFRDKIGRDRHDRRKRVVDTKNGQYAETHVSRLKQFPNKTSLVRCKLKTGRTIRFVCTFRIITSRSWVTLSIIANQRRVGLCYTPFDCPLPIRLL